MYTLVADGNVIHDPRTQDLLVQGATLRQEANTIGSVSFTILPTHAFIGRLAKLQSIVEVYHDTVNRPIFRGRVLEISDTKINAQKIVVEEVLAYLQDSVFRPFIYEGGVEEFFLLLLKTHNDQVSPAQQIRPGLVTVTDPNNFIVRSSIYHLSTWEVIQTRLVDLLGGYLRMRYEEDGTYLDYLTPDPAHLDTSAQSITFGENLVDILLTTSAEETYTACIPLGSRLSDLPATEGEEDEERDEAGAEARVTIESVNDGIDYLVNEEARAKYGWIVAPVEKTTWDDVTLPENLILRGREFLNATGVKFRETLTLTAIDLHNADASIESFRFLDFVTAYSSVHGIGASYILTRLELPLSNPGGAKITLGDKRLSLIESTLSDRRDAAQQMADIRSEASSASRDAAYAHELLTATEERLSSLVGVTEARIITQVARDYVEQNSFQTYKESTATRFAQTEAAFDFRFTSTNDLITQLNGDTTRRLESLERYIRFEAGNIILGEVGSPLSLTISHDRISFQMNNNEVAYFSANRLYVTNLEALSTLTLGNFAFFPRPGNQNLSFRRVKGG